MTDDGRDADMFYPTRARQSDSRDEEARRKVADQVRDVVKSGATRIARRDAALLAGHVSVPSAPTGREVATAASAVVLASDLRAAEITGDELIEQVGHVMGLPVETRAGLDEARTFIGVSLNRQGWRARLVNVEFMLRTSAEWFERGGDHGHAQGRACLDDALATVRSMIDGEGFVTDPPQKPFDPLGGAHRGVGRCTCYCGAGTDPNCPVHP